MPRFFFTHANFLRRFVHFKREKRQKCFTFFLPSVFRIYASLTQFIPRLFFFVFLITKLAICIKRRLFFRNHPHKRRSIEKDDWMNEFFFLLLGTEKSKVTFSFFISRWEKEKKFFFVSRGRNFFMMIFRFFCKAFSFDISIFVPYGIRKTIKSSQNSIRDGREKKKSSSFIFMHRDCQLGPEKKGESWRRSIYIRGNWQTLSPSRKTFL